MERIIKNIILNIIECCMILLEYSSCIAFIMLLYAGIVTRNLFLILLPIGIITIACILCRLIKKNVAKEHSKKKIHTKISIALYIAGMMCFIIAFVTDCVYDRPSVSEINQILDGYGT